MNISHRLPIVTTLLPLLSLFFLVSCNNQEETLDPLQFRSLANGEESAMRSFHSIHNSALENPYKAGPYFKKAERIADQAERFAKEYDLEKSYGIYLETRTMLVEYADSFQVQIPEAPVHSISTREDLIRAKLDIRLLESELMLNLRSNLTGGCGPRVTRVEGAIEGEINASE